MESEQWKEWREKWRCVLLSTPCAFSEIPRSEFWKHAFNKRQSCLQDHESWTRTAMQSSMEIAAMKTIAEAQLGKKLSTPALSAELLRLGLQPVVSGRKDQGGQEEEDANVGSLSSNFITAALNAHKFMLSNPICIELLMDLESRWGTRSPFHKMTNLNALATKPASAKSRQWVTQSLHDWLCNGQLKLAEVSRSSLVGDRHHCGLIAMFEMKQKDPCLHLNLSLSS